MIDRPRLSRATLHQLPEGVGRPAYDPAAIGIGIVHFGPGAFHRAHQAAYVDDLLAADPRWGIAEVSLRTGGPLAELEPQDNLYTLSVLDRQSSFRVIGAIAAGHRADDHEGIARRLADPRVRMVTSTVTEKGYCLAGDGSLDLAHPDIVHDLGRPDRPRSLIGWIARGLALRREAGVAPFVAMACDNMTDNGGKLGRAVAAYCRKLDPALADWVEAEACFPASMVDSITPATDEPLRERVAEAIGLEDRVPVQREAFVQWVVEDRLPGDMPDLASVGVTLTRDVAAHERAKLRVLNGAHSTLAYLGLLLGHETVSDAMGDARLAGFVERMVLDDIVPSLGGAGGIDGRAYAGRIFDRFRNPAIRHKLSQIAWDGSQKLPYRLLSTIAEALDAGRPIARLTLPVAAWFRFLELRAAAGEEIVDPLAGPLGAAARTSDAEAAVAALLAFDAVFPRRLAEDGGVRDLLVAQLAKLRGEGADAALKDASG